MEINNLFKHFMLDIIYLILEINLCYEVRLIYILRG